MILSRRSRSESLFARRTSRASSPTSLSKSVRPRSSARAARRRSPTHPRTTTPPRGNFPVVSLTRRPWLPRSSAPSTREPPRRGSSCTASSATVDSTPSRRTRWSTSRSTPSPGACPPLLSPFSLRGSRVDFPRIVPEHVADLFPSPPFPLSWCEHDPDEIYANTVVCMEKALSAVPGGATASDVACVGITNQRETTVAWRASTGAPCTTPSCGWTRAPRGCARTSSASSATRTTFAASAASPSARTSPA